MYDGAKPNAKYHDIADEEDAISLLTEEERKRSHDELDEPAVRKPPTGIVHAVKMNPKCFWTLVAVLIILTLAWPTYHSRAFISSFISSFTSPTSSSSLSSPPLSSHARFPTELLRELYEPIKVPVLQENFTLDGETFSLNKPYWTFPRGKEVLILDVDSRPLDRPGQYLDREHRPWSDFNDSTAGLLNHYLYSQIHDYDYHFIHASVPKTVFGSWSKIHTIRSKLSSYKLIVFLDADAIFAHPEVPLEWLLNHWGVPPHLPMAVSTDPPMWKTADKQLQANTGFMVVQPGPRTEEIFDAWIDCPSGQRFPGCEITAQHRVYDQRAWNEYLRKEYQEGKDWKLLPCAETDGYPGSGLGCRGVFVQHMFWNKGKTKQFAVDALVSAVGERLRNEVLVRLETLVEETVFEGAEVPEAVPAPG